MQKLYITFSGETYNETTAKIVSEAPKLGADKVLVYDDTWLMEQEFYRLNNWLWTCPGTRGFGWFAWKPFIMLDALNRCDPGDVVLFTDGDTYPIADFSMLYRECDRLGGMMLFAASGCSNRHWCKRDAFVVTGLDQPKYHDVEHAVARFFLFQKGPWHVQQFLMEWLTYCINPLATTFDPSVLKPELEGFRQSRAEQALLTLLAHKYGHKLHREACQFGDDNPQDRELFPTLFHQRGMSAGGPKPTTGSRFRNV